jgi:hypothetical protein
MPKTAALIVAVLLSMASSAMADGRLLTDIQFEYEPTNDAQLPIDPQKVKWQFEKVMIWADVKNTSSRRREYVALTFTALDENRKFLGRCKTYSDPDTLEAGETGHVNSVSIDTEARIPSIIQVRVAAD